MTICIVARCWEQDSFAIAGDRLFSYNRGQYLYDSITLKRLPVSLDRRWECMFSGDVPNVLPVVRRVREELQVKRPPFRLDAIEAAFRKAYQDYRAEMVMDQILSAYGYKSINSYRRRGLKEMGPRTTARINSLIESIKVGVSFIVYGYDDFNMAHVFTLSERYSSPFTVELVCREQDGIAVIGCGDGHAAASLLDRRAPLPIISQAEMLCRVCEAKFDAEQHLEVGRDSAAGIVNRPRSTMHPMSEVFITTPALDEIRKLHNERRDRPYPPELIEALVHCIKSNLTTERMHEAVWRAEQQIIAERLRERYG